MAFLGRGEMVNTLCDCVLTSGLNHIDHVDYTGADLSVVAVNREVDLACTCLSIMHSFSVLMCTIRIYKPNRSQNDLTFCDRI